MKKKSKIYLGIFLSAAMLMGTCSAEAGEMDIFSDGENFSISREASTKSEINKNDNCEQNVFDDGSTNNAGDGTWVENDRDEVDWNDNDSDDDSEIVHKYKIDTIKPATENESGEIVSICEICGEKQVEEIPKLEKFDVLPNSFIYNGSIQKPERVIVSDIYGNSISESYYDVVCEEDSIEPGEYAVMLNFKGNYSGTKSLKYYIEDNKAKIEAPNMTVTVGDKNKKLDVKVTGDHNGLRYKSSNSKIASISANGKITAKRAGTVVITIIAGATKRHDAVTKDITVKVIPPSTQITSISKAGKSKLKLEWKTVSGVDGYAIYRDGYKIKTIKGSSVSSYTDSSLKNGTKYYYEIRTYKKVNGKVYYSDYSDIKGATTIDVNVNYEGGYKSSSGELAIFKEGYKYDYMATVRITGLCNLYRLRCRKVNEHLEFAGYDPAGNIMYGTIKKSGNKVTFKITDTTWTYFDDGDTYVFYE